MASKYSMFFVLVAVRTSGTQATTEDVMSSVDGEACQSQFEKSSLLQTKISHSTSLAGQSTCRANCKVCASTTSCMECDDFYEVGTFYDSVQGQTVTDGCLQCAPSCKKCPGHDCCSVCDDGFYLEKPCNPGDRQNQCKPCTAASSTAPECLAITTCPYNLPNCKACLTSTSCIRCDESYEVGTFYDSVQGQMVTDGCLECPANCKSCPGHDCCSVCDDGFYLEPTCDPGDRQNQCKPCTASSTAPECCHTEIDPSLTSWSNQTQCQKAMSWAKNSGFGQHPEWYAGSGLTTQSSWQDWQEHFASNGGSQAQGCLQPCPTATTTTQTFFCHTEIDPSLTSSSDQTECQKAMSWAKDIGFGQHPEWYAGSGLTTKSSWQDWQEYFASKGGTQAQGCLQPCPTATTTTQSMCRPNCKVCASTTSCMECDDFYEVGTFYDSVQGQMVTDGCLECPANCKSCPGHDCCSVCDDGFYLEPTCDPGDRQNQCKPCTASSTAPECCHTEIDPSLTSLSDQTQCQKAMLWAKNIGLGQNPEWYKGSGLTTQSSWRDWQEYFASKGGSQAQGCLQPC